VIVGSYGEIALVRGLSFLAEKQAAIANNLANVDTTSFKRRATIAREERGFQGMLDEQMSAVSYTEQSDMSRGTIRETGNLYDLALDGPQWLRVQDKQGNRYYTRNGQLQLAPDGRLSTRDGLAVLDNAGQPILIGAGAEAPSEIRFSPNGTISNPANGQTWGPLALVQFPDEKALTPVGKSLYVDSKGQRTAQAADGVQQGYLEGSNVDTLQELVAMISVERSFTATQKVLTGIGRLQENLITNILR
jgi:flagellar basal-body rod protein FlgF